ncbi:MAG: tetratricopeptide repeat protein [Deltaproteobacteria bacterium]|nr:tetratricopeptide repeat protein [Deltaproteobacteria bacterium]
MYTKQILFFGIFAFLVLQAGQVRAAQLHEADDLISFSQHRLSRDPDNFAHYNALAFAYMQKARETGDVSYYDRAEDAAKKSLALVPRHTTAATATKYLAAIHLAKHRFDHARRGAQQALRLDASDPSAYAIIGDAALELGEYENAAEAYKKLQGHSRALAVDERVAYLHFLRGDVQRAIKLMRHAVELGETAKQYREHVAWSQTQLGDLYFATGDFENGSTTYEAALATYPKYHRAQAGLARVRAAQGHALEAIHLYQQAIATIPLPEYVSALGDLYAALRQPEEAQKQYALIEYMATLSERNQTLYNRELALFYADHDQQLTKALALAQKELEVRRDIYTYDVLAWALYKNNKLPEAQEAMQRALRLGTQDARLFFHAGMIYQRLGKRVEAQTYLQRALRLNPRFHPLQADLAMLTLATLRGKPAASAAQEKNNDRF